MKRMDEAIEEEIDCLERDCSVCPYLPYCDVGAIFAGLKAKKKEVSE